MLTDYLFDFLQVTTRYLDLQPVGMGVYLFGMILVSILIVLRPSKALSVSYGAFLSMLQSQYL